MSLRLLAIASLLLQPALVGAQAERLTVQMTPAPNQTFHVHTTSDMTMTMSADHTSTVKTSPVLSK